MRGARSWSIFLLDDVGSRRFTMNGGTVEDSLATRAGRLFAQYRDGDQAKMGDLVRILTPILWHTARSSRLDSATAEDVLQSAWLTLVRKSDTITEPIAVLQWMVVTTKREAWRVARNQARLRPEDLESSTTAASNQTLSVEDTVLREEGHTRLWSHIEALPKRCRTLLRVIAFADRPDYAELAKALGMPQGSIGPTRGRCLAKLRISLAQDPTWEHQ
jgi:RNA polymerase sigma factor (sigma-70 family)